MRLLVIDDEEDIRDVATLNLGMPLLPLGRYRDLAAAVAARLSASPQQEVIVASAGLAKAITAEPLRGRAGVAGSRLHTIDAFARRLLNDAGDYPRVAADA